LGWLCETEYGEWKHSEQDAVQKEMKNVRLTFKIMNWDEEKPPTYQETHCHMIIDVKIEDFRRSERFDVGDNTTDTHHAMNYASGVLRESVKISLMMAALNDMGVKMADI
jgi:hypothetical protein